MSASSAQLARVLEQASSQSTADQLLSALSTILRGKVAAYVSTPITTGPALLAWRQGAGREHPTGSTAHRAFVELMIDRNTAKARPLAAALETHLGVPVIDPTRLGPIPGWEQSDYHEFWVRAISDFVHTVAFVDGWQYSTGCTLEFGSAATNHLRLLDAQLRTLDERTARSLLVEAVVELEGAGMDASTQRLVLEQLARMGVRE